jgi:hypothetical protein
MQLTTDLTIEYRARTVQYPLAALDMVSTGGELLAPGGSTSTSAGSSCSCTTCGAITEISI